MHDFTKIPVREYTEDCGMNIMLLNEDQGIKIKPRWVVKAFNEDGYRWVLIDLEDLLIWVRDNMPELWEKAEGGGRV